MEKAPITLRVLEIHPPLIYPREHPSASIQLRGRSKLYAVVVVRLL